MTQEEIKEWEHLFLKLEEQKKFWDQAPVVEQIKERCKYCIFFGQMSSIWFKEDGLSGYCKRTENILWFEPYLHERSTLAQEQETGLVAVLMEGRNKEQTLPQQVLLRIFTSFVLQANANTLQFFFIIFLNQQFK